MHPRSRDRESTQIAGIAAVRMEGLPATQNDSGREFFS